MCFNKYLFQTDKQDLITAFKNLKKIDDKLVKINTLRINYPNIEFCATNGQEGIKTSIKIDKISSGMLPKKEYVLNPITVNNFTAFLEISNNRTKIAIEINEAEQEIKLLQNKNVLMSAHYNTTNRDSYLTESVFYSDLTAALKKETAISLKKSNCNEFINISSSVQNELLPLYFNCSNDGICIECTDLGQILHFDIVLQTSEKELIAKNILKDRAASTQNNTLFSLNLKAFKKIVSLTLGNEDNYNEVITLALDNLKYNELKAYVGDSDNIHIVYMCRPCYTAISPRLETVLKNSDFSNSFTVNFEDIEAISAIAPILDKENASLLLDFDLSENIVNISNAIKSDTSFLIKKELQNINYKTADNLKAILFVKYIIALKKYFRVYEKNKSVKIDNIVFKFKTDEKNVIQAYYVETENLQYCFAGGRIKETE